MPAASGRFLSEHESKQLIAAYGIAATREVRFSPEDLTNLKRTPLPYPLALKIVA